MTKTKALKFIEKCPVCFKYHSLSCRTELGKLGRGKPRICNCEDIIIPCTDCPHCNQGWVVKMVDCTCVRYVDSFRSINLKCPECKDNRWGTVPKGKPKEIEEAIKAWNKKS